MKHWAVATGVDVYDPSSSSAPSDGDFTQVDEPKLFGPFATREEAIERVPLQATKVGLFFFELPDGVQPTNFHGQVWTADEEEDEED